MNNKKKIVPKLLEFILYKVKNNTFNENIFPVQSVS